MLFVGTQPYGHSFLFQKVNSITSPLLFLSEPIDGYLSFVIQLEGLNNDEAKTGAKFIRLHHPSGNLKSSIADEELANKIKCAGQFLDIKVQDHLILNSEGYFSFADEGRM